MNLNRIQPTQFLGIRPLHLHRRRDGPAEEDHDRFQMECSSTVSDVDTCERLRIDLSHTGNTEPPGLCRYPHVDPIDYSCPARRTHMRAEHPDHKRRG